MPLRTVALIYNPNSGKSKGEFLANQFAKIWEQKFPSIPLKLYPSKNAAHFGDLSLSKYRSGKSIIFMGGDGTFSLGLSALFNASKSKKLQHPIGLLPAGSGNSFLRDFGIDSFEKATQKLLEAFEKKQSKILDCGKFEFKQDTAKKTRYFINIWALGLISDINLLAIRLKKSYTLATLLKIPLHTPLTYTLNTDKEKKIYKANFIAVCNSQFTGGKMQMAPMANTADGKLDAIIPCVQNRLALLRLFPKLFSGKHITSKDVLHLSFKKMEFGVIPNTPVMVDGEMDTADYVKIEVVPRSWKLLLS